MKTIIRKMLFLLSVLMLITLTPAVVSAAANPKLIELQPNRLYTTYDINRDGKADQFKWTTYSNTSSKYGYAKLTINGKSTDIFVARGASIHYYRYTRTNTFLLIYSHQYGGGTTSIYRYTGTKPTMVRSVAYLSRSMVSSCIGSYVYFEVSPYHTDNISIFKNVSNISHLTFKMRYKVDTTNHVLKIDSLTANVKTASKFRYTGSTYKTASAYDCKDTKGITLKNGSSYTLKKIHFNPTTNSYGTKVYVRSFYLTNSSGDGGWVKETAPVSFTK